MKQRVLSYYDFFLIIGVIVCNIVYSIMNKDFDAVGSLASIAGVICVVLVAKGSIWNYLFGIINVSLYAWISYKASIYGDAVLNAFYYFPMQFIGYWQWRRRGAAASSSEAEKLSAGENDDVRVRARKMTWKQRAVLFCGCLLLVVTIGLILKYFTSDPQPFKDSTTTVLSIIAQALMALAFMEQWALWIITNVVSVVMWCICTARGDAHAGLMVIMWIFYLLNSINGLRVWMKLSSKQAA